MDQERQQDQFRLSAQLAKLMEFEKEEEIILLVPWDLKSDQISPDVMWDHAVDRPL